MKKLTIMLILLGILLVASIVAQRQLSQSAKQLNDKIGRIEQAIELQQWPEAMEVLSVTRREWDRVANIWSTLTEHQEIDSIEQGFARLEGFLKARDSALALGEVKALSLLVTHIPEKTTLALVNVF